MRGNVANNCNIVEVVTSPFINLLMELTVFSSRKRNKMMVSFMRALMRVKKCVAEDHYTAEVLLYYIT